jgi:fructose-1,6-bisphosphatase
MFGPFSKQQEELTEKFEALSKSTTQKVNDIMRGAAMTSDGTMKKFRSELDRQIEALHLASSNYFGDCEKRRQQVESVISENIDIAGFAEIGEALCLQS